MLRSSLLVVAWALFVADLHENIATASIAYSLMGSVQNQVEVKTFEISPDSRFVVYLADRVAPDYFQLYSTSTEEGDEIFTLFTAPSGEKIQRYYITSDSQRVVVLTYNIQSEKTELYIMPIRGGTISRLSRSNIDWGEYLDFKMSSTGQYAVLASFKLTPNSTQYMLHSIPLDGSPIVRLDASPAAFGPSSYFEIAPNGQTVLIATTGEITIFTLELYTVPIAGGVITKVSGPLANGESVGDHLISPDSQRVVYRAGNVSTNSYQLYSVGIGGGQVTNLSGPLVSGGTTRSVFAITPNSQHVIFNADKITDQVFELFSVPISGGSVTKLSGSINNGGEVFLRFEVSSDSQWVVFQGDIEQDGIGELYSVRVDGTSLSRISGAITPTGSVSSAFEISQNSDYVFYLADKDTPGVNELYRVPIDAVFLLDFPVKVSGSLVSMGQVFDFSVSKKRDQVLFRADKFVDNQVELFSVPIPGESITTISPPLTLINGDVLSYQESENGQYAVFRIRELTTGRQSLFGFKLFEDEGFCLPIKTSNNKLAIVCL